jgi:hypothetical protein
MENSIDAAEAVAGAYYLVQLLPLNPDEAEAILAAVGQVLAQPDAQPAGWTDSASYVLSHLREKEPRTAAATLAVARDIIQAVRPYFVQIDAPMDKR